MDEHQGRKSEMDAREEKIASVLATGEQLIENGHYATSEVSRFKDHALLGQFCMEVRPCNLFS